MHAKLISVGLACTLTVLLTGCRLPSSGSALISVNSEMITLEWDPPSSGFTDAARAICLYRIYYSQHSSGRWFFLGDTPASDHPKYYVHHADLRNGSFDFAVSAVNQLGNESILHTSLDFTSSPVGGWYVRWFLSR
jgi:hypothetical protein